MRTTLLERREQFMGGAPAAEALRTLARHLTTLLTELEPEALGLYWPHRSEFNAASLVQAHAGFAKLAMCLPFAQRNPVQMHYRAWDGAEPRVRDECGIPASDGAPASPDVVLLPCVGFSADGHRLGYGGGYFDRWLAAHPDVTSIGVAWSGAEVGLAELAPQAHDQRLMMILTERGVV